MMMQKCWRQMCLCFFALFQATKEVSAAVPGHLCGQTSAIIMGLIAGSTSLGLAFVIALFRFRS